MILIKKAYKVELKPNRTQITYFLKCIAAVCKVWNFYLEERKRVYEQEKKTVMAQYKGESQKLTQFKQENIWLYEVPSVILVQCLLDQDKALQNYFRRIKQIKRGELSPKEAGYPKFKSCRRKNNIGFRFREGLKIEKERIYLPRIGWVKLKECGYIPTCIEPRNATITTAAGKWFVSVQMEEEKEAESIENGNVLAMHIGIRYKITLSNGGIIDKFLPYHRMEKKLARMQRRKDKLPPGWKNRKDKSYLGSKNKKKLREKIEKLHYRVANKRKNATHNATTQIIRHKPQYLVIEDWENKKMMKDPRFSKGIMDTTFYEPIRQIEYKTQWAGIKIIKLDKGYPSSKICSSCGYLYEDFTIEKRVYKCPECNHSEDRDRNAVKNVLNEGIRLLQQRAV